MSSARKKLEVLPDPDERRAIERAKVEMSAIYLDSTGAQVRCRVVDFSPMGAGLEISGAENLPDAITLHVPAIDMVYEAEVRWRKGDRAGVLFASAERGSL